MDVDVDVDVDVDDRGPPAPDGPLAGLLVLDLGQFLAAPWATLRLQDLGARVIKVERPDGGDLTRRLYLSDTMIDGESTMFHAINRGKQSLALDLKRPEDRSRLLTLVRHADVFVQNFRPGVIERLGLGPDTVRSMAPNIVYCSISGYGPTGPWARLPGQDLLAQARSGVMWLSGDRGQGPVPMGLAIADMMTGANAAHGILAALVRRGLSGRGALVETSLIEAMVDLQFEVLTTHLNDGGQQPLRARCNSAHVGLAAPYGCYRTSDGWLALAMNALDLLGELLELPALAAVLHEPRAGFARRDEIKAVIAARLSAEPTAHWLGVLERRGIWCARVANWDEFLASEAFGALDMLQRPKNRDGRGIPMVRCPLRIDGHRARTEHAAARIGEHNQVLREEFGF